MAQNRTAPDRWVEAHAAALFRYAVTRLRRREDAEDVVQETLLAALKGERGFRGDSAERTWLIGILRHKIVDRIRILAREPVGMASTDDEDDGSWSADTGLWLKPPRSWHGDPAALSENAEFWTKVRACFAGLSERHAQVFALRVMDDMPAEEVCKQLGISATNLGVILHRARTRLRSCLEQTWFAPAGEDGP